MIFVPTTIRNVGLNNANLPQGTRETKFQGFFEIVREMKKKKKRKREIERKRERETLRNRHFIATGFRIGSFIYFSTPKTY